MKLITELLDLSENARSETEDALWPIIRDVEEDIPRLWHYKSWDFNLARKEVTWVTQQTDNHESQELAEKIARKLFAAGFPGWKAKVVVRDKFVGDKSPWKIAVAALSVNESEYGKKKPRKGTLAWERQQRERAEYLKDLAKDPHGKLRPGDKIVGPNGLATFKGKNEDLAESPKYYQGARLKSLDGVEKLFKDPQSKAAQEWKKSCNI